MNRGRRQEDIFQDEGDYLLFLEVLKDTAKMWNLKVSAYCLMTNHYHLLVQTPDGNLARCMRHLNGVYTQRYNRKHDLDGQLFRGTGNCFEVATRRCLSMRTVTCWNCYAIFTAIR